MINLVDVNDYIGLSIKKSYRLFYEDFLDIISDSLKDQETDGSLCLKFSNGEVIEITPLSEEFSIEIKKIDSNCITAYENLKEVSNNDFWKKYINKKIELIELLPNGIQIKFDDSKRIEIIYLSETEYTFDSLIIRETPIARICGKR
ncbi:hypothetical protein C3B47_13400 [Flavobacterium columnare]|uniref:hypothetical protein n=1 Tax=Flavobacterium columnare TaxID=996 RepID=UPI0018969E2B|nr:hypothetical protein [Flavobacterium columnare]MBF6653858.1 hypothetical protein [Flavobacterium columnare]MBF6656660.1 hypothetical protein [Flavobacterium columnare]MBF6659305.1 hypothetical protein [Flavobacterium columnare]